MFECNAHFKCPGYYCIPWGYTCDGKWDCPDGYDESSSLVCGIDRLCMNMFKCKDSQMYLHLKDVCDGYRDCPLEDDEVLCELHGPYCLRECICFHFAITCINLTYSVEKLPYLPYVDYYITLGNQSILTVLQNNFPIIINITHNSAEDICCY